MHCAVQNHSGHWLAQVWKRWQRRSQSELSLILQTHSSPESCFNSIRCQLPNASSFSVSQLSVSKRLHTRARGKASLFLALEYSVVLDTLITFSCCWNPTRSNLREEGFVCLVGKGLGPSWLGKRTRSSLWQQATREEVISLYFTQGLQGTAWCCPHPSLVFLS